MSQARPVVNRIAAMGLVAIFSFGLLSLRGVSVTSSFRAAAAPSVDGSFYFVEPNHLRLLRFRPDGSRQPLGTLPGFGPLSMAVEGETLLVGSEQGLYRSIDGGRSWLKTAPRGLHFTAVALVQGEAVAADWGGGLWISHDSGSSWTLAAADPADLQVNSLLISPGHAWLAATEVAILRSTDGGRSWNQVTGSPDRATALHREGPELTVGTWDGRILTSADDGLTWTLARRLPSGVWWIRDGLVATATGLLEGGRPAAAPLAKVEVVEAETVQGSVFAVQPGPRLWLSSGDGWRRLYPT